MDIYKIEVDYDANGDAPWGTVYYPGDDKDIWPLRRRRPLASTWRTLEVRLVDAEQDSDFVYFSPGLWAVRSEVRDVLQPILESSAEFLRLRCQTDEELFALHPLELADLAKEAEVSQNPVSRNVTSVYRYWFEPQAIAGKRCFRARQPADSSSGPDSGGNDVLVCASVYEQMSQFRFRGIRFAKVFPY